MSDHLVIRAASKRASDAVIPLSSAQLIRRHLSSIKHALPYDAAQVLVFDRSTDRHRQMAQIGYPAEVARVMCEEFPKHWPLPAWAPVLDGDDLPPTISAEQDHPGSFRYSTIYLEYLAPAGFRDGLTLELNHRGRYVGLANFSSFEAAFYTLELRRRSLAFASLLGHAISATAQDLEAIPLSARASVIDQHRMVSPIAGRVPSNLVVRDDFFAALAPLFDAPHGEVAFLWDVDRQWFRVVVRRQSDDSLPDLQPLVVIEAPIERPSGLTPTEIRVLTRLITCSSNEMIANSLGIGIRTVHTHISSILAKLNCTRRSQAVASAVRNGLFRPEAAPDASLGDLIH
ncbi:helix-turn-helix transcriptional regulator [Agromyces endophyticus]|uniref:helix-turn-helix transcriptional regulator n=1 Tax=Agromyces sp. H17E-10 TaxID=2932244 RepID=UPI001FCFD704|nr:helix-turn-helix transcriptional regulator [Agromyces sp. H17E-10]UOQ89127.1 helix-turn-helix transcriptional regulator [Agromyces sp. H17E-10]